MSDLPTQVMQAMHDAGDEISALQIVRTTGEPIERVYLALVALEQDGIAYVSGRVKRYRRATQSKERLWSLCSLPANKTGNECETFA